MPDQPPESALRLPVHGTIDETRDFPPSPLVEEVVCLFDQLRDRLLRYAISFGLPVQDGEDVVQEVFLALFQHLRQGRSRRNLRAWVFAHNHALKRRSQDRSGAQQLVDEEVFLADLVQDKNPEPGRPSSRQPKATARFGRRECMLHAGTRSALPDPKGRRAPLSRDCRGSQHFTRSRFPFAGASLTRLARAAQW
jgi:hypothetical protein